MKQMKKGALFFSFLLLAVFALGGCAGKKEQAGEVKSAVDSSIIFFYGEECSHCKNVEKYFKENGIEEKVDFSQREVYHDKANAGLMEEKAKDCGISESELGVPMLWAEGECYIGGEDIIQFFNNKTGASSKQ